MRPLLLHDGIFLFLFSKRRDPYLGLVFSPLLMLTVIYIAVFLPFCLRGFLRIYIFLSQIAEKRYIFLCMLLFCALWGGIVPEKGGGRHQEVFEPRRRRWGAFLYVSANSALSASGSSICTLSFSSCCSLHYRLLPRGSPYFASPEDYGDRRHYAPVAFLPAERCRTA